LLHSNSGFFVPKNGIATLSRLKVKKYLAMSPNGCPTYSAIDTTLLPVAVHSG
jgi:hypothetical protein